MTSMDQEPKLDYSLALQRVRDSLEHSRRELRYPTGLPIPWRAVDCLCGASTTRLIGTVDRYGLEVPTGQCESCGTVRRMLAMGHQAAWEYYAGGVYRAIHNGLEKEDLYDLEVKYGAALRRLIRIPGSDRGIAEIGSGCSGAVRAYGERNFSVEADPDLRAYGRRRSGLPVFEDVDEMPGGLAGIFSIHCLEHHRAPHEELRRWSRKLAPGGKLISIVPDLFNVHTGHALRNGGGLSRWWDHAHVWEWTQGTVALPHMMAGLAVDRVEVVGPGIFASVGSLLVECTKRDRVGRFERYMDQVGE